MRPLDLQSELFAATGNLASEGARNQLGRPRLDPLTVLVREAVQNSWDARIQPRGDVLSAFALRRVSPGVLQHLRDEVFAERPLKGLPFRERLSAEGLASLYVSDRNTSGLGGPTRANEVIAGEGGHDFVAFLRNLGEPPDKALGGGTYGYGKASFYAVSHLRTIGVHTRIPAAGGFETRFLCAALGDSFFEPRGGRFTGRHWWGREGRYGVVDPLLNEDADQLARALGFPGFSGHDTGTTVCVLDFIDDDGDLGRSAERIKDALLWNFWPKMVPREEGGPSPMRFQVSADDVEIPIPDPADHPTLKHFVRALRSARDRGLSPPAGDGLSALEAIEVQRPRIHTGWLAIARGLRTPGSPSPPTDAERVDSESGVRHVALMRDAELVVRYLEGPPLQTDLLEYGGVFIADSETEVDRAFALAEPPTHDDWVPLRLQERRQKSIVTVSLRRLQECMREFASPADAQQRTASQIPLGALSNRLGGLLTGTRGPGAGLPTEERRATRSTPVVVATEDPEPGASADQHDPASEPGETDLEEEVETQADGASPGSPNSPPGEPPGVGLDPTPPPLRPGRPRLQVRDPELAIEDGLPTLSLEVELKHGKYTAGTDLIVDARAVLDGGSPEKEPPTGAPVPRVLRWYAPDGTTLDRPGDRIRVEPGQEGTWRLYVELVDDAEVQVSVRADRILLPSPEGVA